MQNEKKFAHWDELPGGGRRYRRDVTGRLGWPARYGKEVDANETTLRFCQEIYDDHGTDVRAFGLAWEDCEEHLHLLGYSPRIEVVAA